MKETFCQLHVHSVFSFLDSTLPVETIVRLAREAGMPAVALTDANGLYGAVRFYKACKEAGVKPLVGAEIDDPRTKERAVLLARNFAGYSAISTVVTRRHLGAGWEERDANPGAKGWGDANGNLPVSELNPAGAAHSLNGLAPDDVEFDLLSELRDTSPGEVVILTDALRLIQTLAGREHLYAELTLTASRRRACRELYLAARALGVPLAATCDVHFASEDDYETYKILRAVHFGTTLHRLRVADDVEARGASPFSPKTLGGGFSISGASAQNRKRAIEAAAPFPILPPCHAFKTEKEMRDLFKSLGDAVDATGRIAEVCNLELPLGEWRIPRPPLPEGETAFSALWKVAFEGAKRRWRPLGRPQMDRLRYELDTVDRLGFCEYFLTVHAVAEEARRRGFPVLGRGSAANSVISYALGFTGVDPIRLNLYFERFVNPERAQPPDIDLDFSWRDRDAILAWVYGTFGRGHVAMIATTISLRGRQAIREAAKALGVAESQINRFTRTMPGYWMEEDAFDDLPAAFPECRGLPVDEEPWKTVLPHARKILNFPRHLSVHCGGILICPEPIVRYVPLQRVAKGLVVTQMDMHPIEDLGLIKIDLLANRSLGVLTECLEGIGKVKTTVAPLAGC